MSTQRITHEGTVLVVELDKWTSIKECPKCGSDDIGQWADDGEADAADYWECEECKAFGEMLAPEGLVTPNGIAVTAREDMTEAYRHIAESRDT